MSDLRTAAQQALEALEWHLERGAYGADIEGVTGNLRAALAQQAEPVQDQRCRAEPRSDGDFVCDCKIGGCPGRSTAPPKAEPVDPVATTWRSVLPGGKRTDEWESARIADYNAGWNAYRKAATSALEKLWDNNLRPVVEFRGRRMTPEGTRECWGVLLCDVKQDPPEGTKLYAAPPQRKPLTEEEIDGLVIQHAGYGRDNFYAVARAVELAHGIKEN